MKPGLGESLIWPYSLQYQSCLNYTTTLLKLKAPSNTSWDRPHGRGTPRTSNLGTYRLSPLDIRPGNLSPLPLLVTSGSDHWGACSKLFILGPIPWEWHLVVASETGSTYGFQTGSTHPNGILLLVFCFSFLPFFDGRSKKFPLYTVTWTEMQMA